MDYNTSTHSVWEVELPTDMIQQAILLYNHLKLSIQGGSCQGQFLGGTES